MTLAVTYDSLLVDIGRETGIGRDPDQWEPDERADVDAIIQRGYRRFIYYPPLPVPEGKPASPRHVWSFLQPTSTLTLVANQDTYELPEDFGELLDGGFASTTGGGMSRVTEDHIRSLPVKTGRPEYFALRPKRQAKTGKQFWEIQVYPKPDAAAVAAIPSLTYRYGVVPDALSDSNQYPIGGSVHGQTLLEACLAEAELTLGDNEGIHSKRFLECLVASIGIDKAMSQADVDGVWPLDTPANGLGINRAYLKRLIGRELQFGVNPSAWSHQQTEKVRVVLQSGFRKFYSPMILPGERWSHNWSFLCPTHTFSTVDGQYIYDLPDDFASPAGPITHTPQAAVLYAAIPIVGEYQLRLKLQSSQAAGRPVLAAVRPKPLDASGVTRYELLLWYIPDGEYTLQLRYQANPDAVDDDEALPYGGQPHAQTIIEACLAAAEEFQGVGNGMHAKKFLECLAVSISHDRKASAPETLGYNHDPSDMPVDRFANTHDLDANIVTYNGVAY